ncbi:MAG: RrF2 family transcriptional regulator [Rhodoferax sp.]
MRLTQWSDYSLRVLMYCAASQGRQQPVTISEISESHGISRSHLTKVVQQLATLGWLETTRGRGGGTRLLVPAEQLSLGTVVRATETDFTLVECFDARSNLCRMSQHCGLKGVLGKANAAFLAELDAVTLADLVAPQSATALPAPGTPRARLVPGLPTALAK